jgi:hypothetical protein
MLYWVWRAGLAPDWNTDIYGVEAQTRSLPAVLACEAAETDGMD